MPNTKRELDQALKARIREAGGDHVALMHLLGDIEHNRQQIELAHKEWEAALDAIHDPVFMHDREFRVIRSNRAYAQRAGMSVQDVIGKLYWEVFPSLDGPLDSCRSGMLTETNEEVAEEVQIGEELFLSRSFMVKDGDGAYLYSFHILEDITERKHAEVALRESEQKFHAMGASAQDAIIMIDHMGNISFWNAAAEKILGYSNQEVLGKNLHTLIAPERFLDAHRKGFGHFQQTGEGAAVGKTLELIAQHKDGSEFSVELSLSAVSIGNQWHAIGIIRDITERKRREEQIEALLKINERAGKLPEKDLLRFGLDIAERLTRSQVSFIHFVNEDQETIELATWSSATMEKYCNAGYDSHYPIAEAGIWADSFRQRQPVIFNDYMACANKRGLPEGHSPLQRLISVPVIEGEYVRVILGVGNKQTGYDATDVETVQLIGGDLWRIAQRLRTESKLEANLEYQTGLNKKLEEANSQLLQSEKMASIGQLAAGVAHEINNPIGYVSSNLGSLQKYLENILAVVDAYEKIEPLLAQYPQALADITAAKGRADLAFLKEDVPALMSESREGITRVRQIVQNLKDFSHAGSDEEWQQADLRHGLESTLNIVWNELKYKCEVKKDYAEIPNIECLPSQLNQVFMNLLVNAAYAIEGKGIITIRTGTQGDHVWVEVADTGKGIAPENLDRIFDPFFTTKPVGKGTGLGLSVSYSILQTHHGRINVASEVGKGTTFHILLPVKQPKAEHEAPASTAGTG